MTSAVGVLFGLACTIDPSSESLRISPGLAIDGDGQNLRLESECVVDLPRAADAHGRWIVEVRNSAAVESDDHTPVQAATSSSSIQPLIHLRPDLLDVAFDQRGDLRSNLAAAYFERERISAIEGDSTPQHPALAYLWTIDGVWAIDLWIARRDLGDPPPRSAWQWRLGMRPWPVFLAQVLQFQGQLADAVTVPDMTLGAAGIHELPPAGRIPLPEGSNEQRFEWARKFFGDQVDLRMHVAPLGEIGKAVDASQHLERIPLYRRYGEESPRVNLFVPTHTKQQPARHGLSWATFVNGQSTCSCH